MAKARIWLFAIGHVRPKRLPGGNGGFTLSAAETRHSGFGPFQSFEKGYELSVYSEFK